MTDDVNEQSDRRAFLTRAGRLALVAPPAMTFLLSTTMSSSAIASSGENCNRGGGNGPEECDPGNSGGKPGNAGEGGG